MGEHRHHVRHRGGHLLLLMEEHLHHVLRRGGGDHLLLLLPSRPDDVSVNREIRNTSRISSLTWGSTDITSGTVAGAGIFSCSWRSTYIMSYAGAGAIIFSCLWGALTSCPPWGRSSSPSRGGAPISRPALGRGWTRIDLSHPHNKRGHCQHPRFM